jgi:hypothetical protein
MVLGGCGDSIESGCRRTCEKLAECGLLAAAGYASIGRCYDQCSDNQAEFDRRLESGQTTPQCRDATIDFGNCVTDRSCAELRRGDVSACSEERAESNRACSMR